MDQKGYTKSLRDVIIFLDNGGPELLLAKMFRRVENRLLEIRVLKQSHERGSFACQERAFGKPANNPKSKRENGFK